MSEFNELVKSFLHGNNIPFEESEKEPDTFLITEMRKKKGFFPKILERLNTQKESVKIHILDGFSESNEWNNDADIVIWNDSYSGRNLNDKIQKKLLEKYKDDAAAMTEDKNSRFLGLGRDILFAKYSGENRVNSLLDMGKVPLKSSNNEVMDLISDQPGKIRFIFIVEDSGDTHTLKQGYQRFMENFCRENGLAAQSLPLWFDSIDLWFGGNLHTQLVNRLNQDLGLFLTEDTVFYMMRLGYLIPFINEMDLYCREGYLNPQADIISHLFHICGEKGMFLASCSRDSLLYDDIQTGVDFEKLNIKKNTEWRKMIAKPMGSRILEDEANSLLVDAPADPEESGGKEDALSFNQHCLRAWIENPDFPILKPVDKILLIKQVAAKWMERGACFLDLEEFRNILFSFELLPEGKRTLAHVHEIIRATMKSNILILSDFSQIIPVSRKMGEAIIIWMLSEEFYSRESLDSWLNRKGFNQKIFRELLKRFANDQERNLLTPMATGILNFLNEEHMRIDQRVTRNSLELYIAISNYYPEKINQPITGGRLNDLEMSHEILNGLVFYQADMHNILFQQSVFLNCVFRECILTSSYFAGSTFLNCRFEKTNMKNADFSGSFFRNCMLKDNMYDDLILIGCYFDGGEIDLDLSGTPGSKGPRVRYDGSEGIQGAESRQNYDLLVLTYILQKRLRFYSRYGFKIDGDVEFSHFRNKLGIVSNISFMYKYSYYDYYDELYQRPELYFAKQGSIHYVNENEKLDYTDFENQRIYIDHVIKYHDTGRDGISIWRTKIIYHTTDITYVEDNPDKNQWFDKPADISKKIVGRGVSSIFINANKILSASSTGGLFILEYKDGEWVNSCSKFQSETINKIFPDCFENMAFVRRGASVIEIWDTLNDLTLLGRLVTSFRDIIGIRLIENLNHAIVYGEWGDGTVGALAYNIVNKHLVTYWEVLGERELSDFFANSNQELEGIYEQEVEKSLKAFKEKILRQVSLEKGFLKRGCKELREIMDTLHITSPAVLTYMEGEPVEFGWKITSTDPGVFPVNKVLIDIATGEKADFEFQIKIGDILNIPSGRLRIIHDDSEISVLWREDFLATAKNTSWGDYKITFIISLLGEEKHLEDIFKLRPKNPFRGGVSLSKEMGSDYLFVGRENELRQSLELISSGESFTIRGARRIGKTSFIHRLRENLPGQYLGVYISLEEFEENSTPSVLMPAIHSGLTAFQEKYPAIYHEFREYFDMMRSAKNTMNFDWLMSTGLEKLKEGYPDLLKEIKPELEKYRQQGNSLSFAFNKLSQYLKRFDPPMKVVFIVDEIGLAKKKGVTLSEIFNNFRIIIDNNDIIIILAGIPFNFDELTNDMDLITDSGFMSFVGAKIILGPLTDGECKKLIRENLSQRIHICDDVLNYALQASAKRPEDLQIIMQFALKEAADNTQELYKQVLNIERWHILKGFDVLMEQRGYTCGKIWEKISENGKLCLKNTLNISGFGDQPLLDTTFNESELQNLSKEDIEVFKGYGFSNPLEKKLIIPVYFKEWVRLEFFKRQLEKEYDKYED